MSPSYESECHDKQVAFTDESGDDASLSEITGPAIRTSRWERLKNLLLYAIYSVFLLSFMLLFLAYTKSVNSRVAVDPSRMGLEGIPHVTVPLGASVAEARLASHKSLTAIGVYGDAPLGSHRQILKKAGFHDGPPNAYEGRPTAENDAAWADLMSVGMISISEAENARLPMGGSAQVREANGLVPDKYLVQTSVSHQLHCLKRLRELIWDSEKGLAEHWQYGHGSHCIDYLRQSLMCHGDLTPIYMMWSEEHGSFMGVQENIMQCRSWEAIVEWSAARNDTGMRVDGNHGKNTKTHGFVEGD
ncbi:tat pathway signal sequence [Colletotrichum higginsianum]|nr:tat pathway signal sequence [Colletotrichum higginsianum]